MYNCIIVVTLEPYFHRNYNCVFYFDILLKIVIENKCHIFETIFVNKFFQMNKTSEGYLRDVLNNICQG